MAQRIDGNNNFAAFTPILGRGRAGNLPNTMQGSTGSITIYACDEELNPITLTGAVTGTYWIGEDRGNVYTIDGTLTNNGATFNWDISTTDTAVAGNLSVVFSNNGLTTEPIFWKVTGNPAEDGTPVGQSGLITDNIYTLIGVPKPDTDLGTFDQDIISDNANVKTALQELETAISNSSSHDPVTIGTPNGLSISGQEISLALASAGVSAGAMSSSDKTKLDGIESGATADQTGSEIVSSINTELGQTTWQNQADISGKVDKSGDSMSGPLLIDPLDDGVILTIKGHTSQLENMQEWQNSFGTVLTRVDGDGHVGVGVQPDHPLHIQGEGTTATTSSFLIEDSAGAEIFRVYDDSDIVIGSTGKTTKLESYSNARNDLRLYSSGSTSQYLGFYTLGGDAGSAYGEFGFIAQGSAQVASMNIDTRAAVAPFRFFVAPSGGSQTEALTIFSDGHVGAGVANTNDGYKFHIKGGADEVQLVVQAHSTQTDNILEIQTITSAASGGFDERGVLFSHGGTDDTNFIAGQDAGNDSSTGNNCVGIGRRALFSHTNGNQNTVVGSFAGDAVTSGSSNTVIGYNSMGAMQTGQENTVVGSNALAASTANLRNTVVGSNALLSLDNTTGDSNVAVGHNAGRLMTIGRFNAIVGGSAGYGNSSTNIQNNSILGYEAGYQGTIGGVFLGYRAGKNETSNNRLYIANSDTATPLIYGEFDNGDLVFNGATTVRGQNDSMQLAVQAHSTQTENLQEWQDSSGNELSWVNSSGELFSLRSVREVSTATTIDSGYSTILCDTSGGSFTVTLPAVSGEDGRQYVIKNSGTNTVTVDGNGTETIDGDTTKSLTQYESITVHCDGVEWWVI